VSTTALVRELANSAGRLFPKECPLKQPDLPEGPPRAARAYRINPANGLEGSAPIRRGIRPAR
jgi:hypothetical protein